MERKKRYGNGVASTLLLEKASICEWWRGHPFTIHYTQRRSKDSKRAWLCALCMTCNSPPAHGENIFFSGASPEGKVARDVSTCRILSFVLSVRRRPHGHAYLLRHSVSRVQERWRKLCHCGWPRKETTKWKCVFDMANQNV